MEMHGCRREDLGPQVASKIVLQARVKKESKNVGIGSDGKRGGRRREQSGEYTRMTVDISFTSRQLPNTTDIAD